MAEQTTSSIVINAAPASVMGVIADFEAYPSWAQGVKKAEPVDAGKRPEQVYFELDASPIKDAYTLAYDWDGDDGVTWSLVVDISIPMIGMLKRKAEKVIIDTALKGLKKRVESLA